MANIMFLFPGQGTQFVGMGKALAQASAPAREVFERADAALGLPLSRLCWEGPADELTNTVNAQPAIVVTSLACLAALQAAGVQGSMTAGHSVGEYSALAASGVISVEDAIRLARRRGEVMAQAGQKRPGTMTAILGLDTAAIEEACRQASSEGIGEAVVSNLNAPQQIVISGDVAAVKRAAELSRARKTIPLQVSGAFHSPLMDEAAAAFAALLDQTAFSNARAPFVSSATVEKLMDGARIREVMKTQMRAAVRWQEAMELVLRQPPDFLIEVGPGSALSGMVKRIERRSEPQHINDPDSLAKT
ncbi:MAG: ACP S-malonyltransferase, partial [Candidatus Xenobia bacterium]